MQYFLKRESSTIYLKIQGILPSKGGNVVPENKHLRFCLYILYAALGLVGTWLALRYLLPWILPFLLAFAIARLLEPIVRRLVGRYHIRRWFASTMCILLFLVVIIGLLSFLLTRLVLEATELARALPSFLDDISRFFESARNRFDRFIGSAPPGIRSYAENALTGISEKSAELPAEISGRLLSFLSVCASCTPKIILFTITCIISIFFFSCGWPEISGFIMRQLPQKKQNTLLRLKNDLLVTFGKWLKSQLILCCITFGELAAAFLFIGLDYALLPALLIAVIDALPVLGAGTILIPWSLILLLGGNIPRAIAIIVTYAVVALVRSCIEPKLVGSQIGLHPVATLMAMYIGFCCIGVAGMILFPIALITVKQFNDRGYIHLWK